MNSSATDADRETSLLVLGSGTAIISRFIGPTITDYERQRELAKKAGTHDDQPGEYYLLV